MRYVDRRLAELRLANPLPDPQRTESKRLRKVLIEARHNSRPRPEACECCGKGEGSRRLNWDHDHTTERFRGWLCHSCNVTLGHVDDSIDRLLQLAIYLERTAAP